MNSEQMKKLGEIRNLGIENSEEYFNFMRSLEPANDELTEELYLDYLKNSLGHSGTVTFILNAYSSNKRFMMKACELYEYTLDYADYNLRYDKDFVMKALQNGNGSSLKFASEELKNDEEVVRKALETYPKALIYASEELRKKLEVEIPFEQLQEYVKENKVDNIRYIVQDNKYNVDFIDKIKSVYKDTDFFSQIDDLDLER